MSNEDFAHLHIHSEFSLLDGAIRLSDLISITKEYGMSSMSITDHGSLAGTLEFYREAKKSGIKPILGIETYITYDPDGLPNELKHRDNYHMILLASNEIGWKNIMWLNNKAYQENFYYKPRIYIKNLLEHGEGIIGNSACLAGLCAQHATKDLNQAWSDPDNKVSNLIGQMKEAFSGNYYLELMNSAQQDQILYNNFLIEMSKKTDTKLIITADAHYARREDETLHSALMAMQSKKSLIEYQTANDYWHYENCYIRPPQEMLDSAVSVGAESSYWNTLEIAQKCNLDIKLGEYIIPPYDITKDPEYVQYTKELSM